MKRRTLLATGVAGVVGAVAGCGNVEQQSTGQPTVLPDRPDAVYYPTHIEGMEMIGSQRVGDRMVGLFYSYAHRFWTVTGTRTNLAPIEDGQDVHLMASTWDPETETVIPVLSQPTFTVSRDGSEVDSKRAWPMLSQNMGFHFGENIGLDGDGTYDVTVEVPAVDTRTVGGFEGQFGESVTAEFSVEYSREERDGISYETFPDQQGSAAAVDRMEMGMLPLSVAPASGDLPGTAVTVGSVGDARFVAAVDGRTLLVSPRTPYNGFSLPGFSLSATVGEFDGELADALGPDLGAHYRATLPSAPADGAELTVTVDGVPSVSRHEGYETAFLERGSVSTTL